MPSSRQPIPLFHRLHDTLYPHDVSQSFTTGQIVPSTEDNRDLEVLHKSQELCEALNNRLRHATKRSPFHIWTRVTSIDGITLYLNPYSNIVTTTIPNGFLVDTLPTTPVDRDAYAISVNAAYARLRRISCTLRRNTSSVPSLDSSDRMPPSRFALPRKQSAGSTTRSTTLAQLKEMLFEGTSGWRMRCRWRTSSFGVGAKLRQ